MSKSQRQVSCMRTVAVAGLALLALAGCRPEEQGRVMHYEQGVYKGSNPDKPMSEDALAELRARATSQGGLTGGSGGPSPSNSDNVRPPEASEALKQRMKQGAGN